MAALRAVGDHTLYSPPPPAPAAPLPASVSAVPSPPAPPSAAAYVGVWATCRGTTVGFGHYGRLRPQGLASPCLVAQCEKTAVRHEWTRPRSRLADCPSYWNCYVPASNQPRPRRFLPLGSSGFVSRSPPALRCDFFTATGGFGARLSSGVCLCAVFTPTPAAPGGLDSGENPRRQ